MPLESVKGRNVTRAIATEPAGVFHFCEAFLDHRLNKLHDPSNLCWHLGEKPHNYTSFGIISVKMEGDSRLEGLGKEGENAGYLHNVVHKIIS